MASPDTITISGTDYTVYAAVADVTDILQADYNRATGWAALTSAQQDQAVVTATLRFDRLLWAGERTDPDTQVIAWPRTDMPAIDGITPGTSEFPTRLLRAFAFYCYDLTATADLETQQNAGSNQRRLKAGSVEIEFFRGTDLEAGVLPKPYMELVGPWLGGPSIAVGALTGGDDTSNFSSTGYGLHEPYA